MSEVEICNRALIKIGEKTILSLADNSKPARICNTLYAPTRDLVLRSHPWNFAIKRVELAQNTAGPAYDYAYSYKLPTDCLRVLIPNREIWEYGIEGRNLVTDYAGSLIKYIARITDPNIFDSSFAEALACKIAAEAAVALTDNDPRHTAMVQLYGLAIADARSVNAMEAGPKWFTSEQWLDARRSGVEGSQGIYRGEPK
jgi:hypothetical protein